MRRQSGQRWRRSHQLDRGDIIDMLEEAILKHLTVIVVLDNNHTFEDHVKEIVAQDGEDHVIFAQHETIALRKIYRTQRAKPPEHEPVR